MQGFADFQTACAVCESLDHAGQFGCGLEQRAEIPHIINKSSEVDAHNRLVRLLQDTTRDNVFIIAQYPHHGSTGAHILVRGVFDYLLAMREEFHFLSPFGFKVREVLAMLLANIRNNAKCRTNDRFESLHLTRHRYTSLKDSELGIGIHLPNRQRHAYLGVIRLRRAHNAVVILQELIEPLFDHGLAVGACDADDGDIV